MDTRNFTIGVLSTTAVILLVGLIVIQTRPGYAYASGMTATGGTYRMTVGSPTVGDEELVYITDRKTKRLVIYRFNARPNPRNPQYIELVQGIDFNEMRTAAGSKTKQPAAQPGTRRVPPRRP